MNLASVHRTMKISTFAAILPILGISDAFVAPAGSFSRSSSQLAAVSVEPIAPAPANKVVILQDADAVGSRIRDIVIESAAKAIEEKGFFALAIPGGSILKMLVGSGVDQDWTSKTTIAYVNHKCVDMADGDLATHAKAMKLFMGEWKGCSPIIMGGTDKGAEEAMSYETKLRALSQDVLERDENGLPVFDLALVGVGDDGHVGSLYPNRNEVLEEKAWILPVEMKSPPSITMSLPVMRNAKQVVVAACGVSEKYPQGKSEGMRRAVASDEETIQSFPAVGLRAVATWIMDEAAASKLGDSYN